MSTDYELICDQCKKRIHLATRFTGGAVFGLASCDVSGRRDALEFIVEHVGHNQERGPRVICEHMHGEGDYEDLTKLEDLTIPVQGTPSNQHQGAPNASPDSP